MNVCTVCELTHGDGDCPDCLKQVQLIAPRRAWADQKMQTGTRAHYNFKKRKPLIEEAP